MRFEAYRKAQAGGGIQESMRGMVRIGIVFYCMTVTGLGSTAMVYGAGPIVSGNLSIGGRFDDNAQITETDRTASYVTVVSPVLTLAEDRSGLRSSLTYAGSLEYHSPLTQLNNVSHSVGLSLSADLSPLLSMTINETFHESPDSLRTGLNPGLLLPRITTLSNTVSVSADYSWTRRSKIDLAYLNSLTIYDATSLVDYNSHRISGSISYDFSQDLTGNLSYSRGWTLPSESRAINAQTFSAGISWDPLPRTHVAGSIGVTTYRQDASGSTLFASAMMSRSFERGTLNINYTRDVSGTGGAAQGLALTEVVSASYSHRLLSRLSGSVSGAYSKNSSTFSRSVDARSYSGNAVLALVMTERITGRIGYEYFRQNSQGVIGRTLTRNQADVSLVITF